MSRVYEWLFLTAGSMIVFVVSLLVPLPKYTKAAPDWNFLPFIVAAILGALVGRAVTHSKSAWIIRFIFQVSLVLGFITLIPVVNPVFAPFGFQWFSLVVILLYISLYWYHDLVASWLSYDLVFILTCILLLTYMRLLGSTIDLELSKVVLIAILGISMVLDYFGVKSGYISDLADKLWSVWPILLYCPEKPWKVTLKQSMLGLGAGDVLLSGFLIVGLAHHGFFWPGILAYSIGIALTVLVQLKFKADLPALMLINPPMIVSVILFL